MGYRRDGLRLGGDWRPEYLRIRDTLAKDKGYLAYSDREKAETWYHILANRDFPAKMRSASVAEWRRAMAELDRAVREEPSSVDLSSLQTVPTGPMGTVTSSVNVRAPTRDDKVERLTAAAVSEASKNLDRRTETRPPTGEDAEAARRVRDIMRTSGYEESLVREAHMPGGLTKFAEHVKSQWYRGDYSTALDMMYFDVAVGRRDEAEVEEFKRRFEELVAMDESKARNWLSRAFDSFVAMTPPILKGALAGEAAGAAAAAATAAVPAAAPLARGVGKAVGSAAYWYSLGVGGIYRQLREEGVEHSVAAPAALLGGVPYAAVEYLQVEKLLPGSGKRIIGGVMAKGVRDLMVRYGKDWMTEVTEEGIQEAIQQATVDIAKAIRDKNPDAARMFVNAAGAMWRGIKESALPMIFMLGTSAAVQGGYDLASDAAKAFGKTEGGRSKPAESAPGKPPSQGPSEASSEARSEGVVPEASRPEASETSPSGASEALSGDADAEAAAVSGRDAVDEASERATVIDGSGGSLDVSGEGTTQRVSEGRPHAKEEVGRPVEEAVPTPEAAESEEASSVAEGAVRTAQGAERTGAAKDGTVDAEAEKAGGSGPQSSGTAVDPKEYVATRSKKVGLLKAVEDAVLNGILKPDNDMPSWLSLGDNVYAKIIDRDGEKTVRFHFLDKRSMAIAMRLSGAKPHLSEQVPEVFDIIAGTISMETGLDKRDIYEKVSFERSGKDKVVVVSGKRYLVKSVTEMTPEMAVIRFYKAADVEAAMHEIAHVFRGLVAVAHPGLSDAMNAAYGKESRVWDQETEEKFASDFVKWVTTVKAAKDANVARVFSMIGKSLLAVNEKIADMPPLTAEKRRIFERLVGKVTRATGVAPLPAAEDAKTRPEKAVAYKNPHMRELGEERTRRVTDSIIFDAHVRHREPGEVIKSLWDKFIESMVDDLAPVKEVSELASKMMGGKLEADRDPYVMFRLTRGWYGPVRAYLYEGRPGGKPSLKEILSEVKYEDRKLFSAYLVSRRAVELAARGIESGISVADAVHVVKECDESGKNFGAVAEKLYDYQNSMVAELVKCGLITESAASKILAANQFYVPFRRDVEVVPTIGLEKSVGVSSPLKRIKGGIEKIHDPVASIIRNTFVCWNIIFKQRALNALCDLAEECDLGDYIAKEKSVPKTSSESDISDTIAETMEVFETLYSSDAEGFWVVRDGRREYYRADPRLLAAISTTRLDKTRGSILLRLLSIPARILRLGATTMSPEFGLSNIVRDQVTAAMHTGYKYVPGIDLFRGLASYIGKDDYYKEWIMSGGYGAVLVRSGENPEYKEVLKFWDRDPAEVDKDLRGIGKLLSDFASKTLDTLSMPLNILEGFSEASEAATRLGEYIKARESGASVEEAAFASREVTLDFARQGYAAREANKIIAFLSANINGTVRVFEEMKKDPKLFAARVASNLMMPTIVLLALSYDDDELAEVPEWVRQTYWVVRVGKTIVRIPKPQGLYAMFASVPEVFLDGLFKSGDAAVRRLVSDIKRAVEIDIIPTVARPLLEAASGYSFFRKQRIEPRSLERLLPEDRYGLYTTEVAKALGGLLGMSPMIIDNIIAGYTAGLGRLVLWMIDRACGKDVPLTLGTTPVVRAFFAKDPVGTSSASVIRFWEDFERIEQAHYSLRTSDGRRRREILRKHPEARHYERYREAADNMVRLQNAIVDALRSDMPAERKLRIVRECGVKMTRIAAEANRVTDRIRHGR